MSTEITEHLKKSELSEYMKPTGFINSDHPLIVACVEQLGVLPLPPQERAVALFRFVRDEIQYEFLAKLSADQYIASTILEQKRGFCVQKAVLLCALGRAAGLHTGLVLSDVRDQSLSLRMVEAMKTNILHHHGLNAFYLEGRWLKCDASLSPDVVARKNFIPVEFNGNSDALHATKTRTGSLHAEYIKFYGIYADVPLEQMIQAYRQAYAGADMEVITERAARTQK